MVWKNYVENSELIRLHQIAIVIVQSSSVRMLPESQLVVFSRQFKMMAVMLVINATLEVAGSQLGYDLLRVNIVYIVS